MIQSGWPDSKRNIAPEVSPYFPFRDELVVEEGLIMRGDRLVVPHALRKGVIKDLHAAHQGVESTLRRARECIYWPGMKSAISYHVSHCETCASYGPKTERALDQPRGP